MICQRCGASMTYEKIYTKNEPFWTWKCLFCGEYLDEVILENRERQNRPKAERDRSSSV